MKIDDIIKQNGEKIIDKWSLNFIFEGGRSNGYFIVTDKNIYFRELVKITKQGITLSETDDGFIISRSDIVRVEEFRVWKFFKRFKIFFKDESTFVFDRGLVSVEKIVNLIK